MNDISRDKVQYGYLPTFDIQKNEHRANRVVRNLLNLASNEQITLAVRYSRQYMTRELPEWILTKYIDTLTSLVDIADRYQVTLTPEIIYFDEHGRIDTRRMIDDVKDVFPYGDKHGRRMSVNEF